MFVITGLELSFHGILFVVALLTPVIMFITASKFSDTDFRQICLFFAFAFLFGAMRWAGGSMARLQLPITESLLFNFLWLSTGILSAFFGVYGAWRLYKVAQQIGFK
jgi:hypothetical protein